MKFKDRKQFYLLSFIFIYVNIVLCGNSENLLLKDTIDVKTYL